jgi:hypothetical protein
LSSRRQAYPKIVELYDEAAGKFRESYRVDRFPMVSCHAGICGSPLVEAWNFHR